MRNLLLILVFSIWLQASEKIENLVISGPFASVSHPIARIIETNALSDVANKVTFRLWKSPDELRAIAMKNEANFIAIPTNVAANLYNKGVNLKLLNVSVWGILGLVSRDKDLKNLKDLKGKKLIVPFREDMPDIVLRTLLKKEGLDPKKDLELVYVTTPIDAMQMLIIRRADHALLAEPAISMALRKTKSFPVSIVAPELYRSIDLQDEWGKVFNQEAQIPQAGIAVLDEKDPNLTKRFLEEYKKALKWYKENPQAAGELTEKYFPMLNAQAVADSIPNLKLKDISAKDAKKDLEFFFEILKENEPKLIGSKMPDSAFYR